MVSERDRIINLVNYLESCGIVVNIGKNKARGNRGFFKAVGKDFRIDISKNQPTKNVISTLAHEFAHFLHYNYDKTLKSLNFIFENEEDLLAELLSITVDLIPKENIKPLFDKQTLLKKEISEISELLIRDYPDLKVSRDYDKLENKIKKTPLRYLLKYDRVKVCELFGVKYYSVEELSTNSDVEIYLKLKSKRRALRKIDAKISRLNRYYNAPTELFARAFEMFIGDKARLESIAPLVAKAFEEALESRKIKMLNGFVNNCIN